MAAGVRGLYGVMLGWIGGANMPTVPDIHYINMYILAPRKSYSIEGPETSYRVQGPLKRHNLEGPAKTKTVPAPRRDYGSGD